MRSTAVTPCIPCSRSYMTLFSQPIGGILNNPKYVTPYFVNWEAENPDKGMRIRHKYNSAWLSFDACTCQAGTLGGSGGGGFLERHHKRISTRIATVTPIDLCRL